MANSTIIPLELTDGTSIKVEAKPIGEQRVGFQQFLFKDTLSQIQSIASDIAESVNSIRFRSRPERVSVTLGLEIAIESGQITTILVKGSGTANIEITLEWSSK